MSAYTSLLYNETNALSLILLGIVLISSIGKKDLKIKKPSYQGFVVSLMVLIIGDIFWAFVNSDIIHFTPFWGYFTNLVYFVGTLTSVYYLFMLSQDVYGYNGNYVKKSLIIAIPFIIDIIFVLLTPITHLVFTYEGSEYHRTSFYVPTLLIPYLFVLVLCVTSFIRSLMPKYFVIRRSLRIMTVYSAATMALSLFQLVSEDVFPLYVVGGALICIHIYIDELGELNILDPLTRLQSRRALENHLSDLMEKGAPKGKGVYLILADLDDFKAINDIYGRSSGDSIIAQGAKLMKKSVPTGWFIARFSGDEYAAAGICTAEELEHICSQIDISFEDYNNSSQKPYTISVSTGYALLSDGCRSVNDFIKLAEKCLEETRLLDKKNPHAQKSAPSSVCQEVKNDDGSDVITQQDINLWMSSALKNGEFVPYFQPQINISSGAVSGTEALVRWVHPEKGLIHPALFIPVFERNGFIYEMDKYMWHSVCACIRKWKDAGINIPPISVNVSRWDIVQEDFVSVLKSYLEEFRLAPTDLHLEITESAYLFDQDYLISLMVKLQEMGFKIEMDDFGSGYSSLTAFKDLPFNLIKLDSSLVRESTSTEKAGNILEGIVKITDSLNMPVIVEGVEHKEQADFLKHIGCNNMQGFLFAKPMPEEKYLDFLANWSAAKLQTV